MKLILIGVACLAVVLLVVACTGNDDAKPNQELADSVDLDRFMGTWYVHGHSPTFLDKNAYDATETYELKENGKIQTTYRFRKGSHTGNWKTMKPVGWVHDEETNAEWRMKFFGLFSAPYYILYVSPDYKKTVIGHPDRDMAWIMTRSPEISDSSYNRLLSELSQRDYDMEAIRRVSHESR